jgi:hypothetical protein
MSYAPSNVVLNVENPGDVATVTDWLATLSPSARADLGFATPSPVVDVATGDNLDDDEPTWRAFLAYADTFGALSKHVTVQGIPGHTYYLQHPLFQSEGFVTVDGAGSGFETRLSADYPTIPYSEFTADGYIFFETGFTSGGAFIYQGKRSATEVAPSRIPGPNGTHAVSLQAGDSLSFQPANKVAFHGLSQVCLEGHFWFDSVVGEVNLVGSMGGLGPDTQDRPSRCILIHMQAGGMPTVSLTTTAGLFNSAWLVPPIEYRFPLGQWVHVALTYDGAHIRLFCDGDMKIEVAWVGTLVQKKWESFTLGETYNGVGESHVYYGSFTGRVGWLRGQKLTVYTANFTPPTIPNYPLNSNIQDTLFLADWSHLWLGTLDGIETETGVAWLKWVRYNKNVLGVEQQRVQDITFTGTCDGINQYSSNTLSRFDNLRMSGVRNGITLGPVSYQNSISRCRIECGLDGWGIRWPSNGPNSGYDLFLTGSAFAVIFTGGFLTILNSYINACTCAYIAACGNVSGGNLACINVQLSQEAADDPTNGLLNISRINGFIGIAMTMFPYGATTIPVVLGGAGPLPSSGNGVVVFQDLEIDGDSTYPRIFDILDAMPGGLTVNGLSGKLPGDLPLSGNVEFVGGTGAAATPTWISPFYGGIYRSGGFAKRTWVENAVPGRGEIKQDSMRYVQVAAVDETAFSFELRDNCQTSVNAIIQARKGAHWAKWTLSMSFNMVAGTAQDGKALVWDDDGSNAGTPPAGWTCVLDRSMATIRVRTNLPLGTTVSGIVKQRENLET